MLSARERIEKQMGAPALVRLHRKLSRLKSTVTVMNTGAHPDDEQNGLLAFLRLEHGTRVIVACSTRGEGGQNALGPERHGALGVLRSREMEEAARIIDADVAWLGHGPDDAIHDFGFSKDGDATFARWGEARIVERLVRAYRKERPDIVIPTFLDVPGQHGHHRAMTRAAEAAIVLAAHATAFPEHIAEGLKPWRVAKYYLPAWSGGGGTYDDALPPPDATITVEACSRDKATGAEYGRIGEWSRYFHASQGMGDWPMQAKSVWPLHLKLTSIAASEERFISDGLPNSLEQLAAFPDLPDEVAAALISADTAIAAAIEAFPHRETIVSMLTHAAGHLENVVANASEEFLALHSHRIERKRIEIDAAILEAASIFEFVSVGHPSIAPGGSTVLTAELGEGARRHNVDISLVLPSGVSAEHTSYGSSRTFLLTASANVRLSDQFLPDWSCLGGNGHASVRASAEIEGRSVTGVFDLEEPFTVSAAQAIKLRPDALLVPLDTRCRGWQVKADLTGEAATLSFDSPAGWAMVASGEDWTLTAPERIAPGFTSVGVSVGGHSAFEVESMSYPHIGRAEFRRPAALNILALDLRLPEGARIAYVGGGADKVGLWLARMGLDVVDLDAVGLAGDLSQFTTIVVGIFAFGLRKDLAAITQRLHQFVENGGHLVTLYHRPSDGWHPDETPVRRLQIGSPSVRWRVTDPCAEVTVLSPDHLLLSGPNLIHPEDWEGWNKERGLYFASSWDECYEPLLSMHDVNEQPLKGALLSAEIGKGRHTHVSLTLHHQMDRLVPGAFRLMANLVQPA
ncbi:PIG-L family deacetylase [Aliirhizobium cellulosilyticum]|uniref:LmbE family N-acetylglucosaminyl deacetylase n=1 Tax=Aliirhizobium cellulosilyticum TaxID=393664 RepID=A0A7W6V5F8_9HYPH|nr:PIG-L family deacetylase [Rhizobium cellulosilyticum]MBB4349837.1 LmbE family N-acetylglucosaminyl deacetylase [Rhizobium cellulosilyticum]MBB4414783.1 LmbE family N-acetylglucosaminyl deacetylase [Rhizobium cellulosilyticum]MBB4449371.1 LmbE family N-acetylglucosaminyl deacetylase [Rhizobium cellulosilyticum]